LKPAASAIVSVSHSAWTTPKAASPAKLSSMARFAVLVGVFLSSGAALCAQTSLSTATCSLPESVTGAAALSVDVASTTAKPLVASPEVLPGWVNSRNQAEAVSVGQMLSGMKLMLRRSPAKEAALDSFMKAQLDPKSPYFHRWLTPEEYGVCFGPTNEEVNKVTAWLESQQFVVTRVNHGRTFVTFDGTVQRVNQAFSTKLYQYNVADKSKMAPATAPVLPTAIASLVKSLHGVTTIETEPQHVSERHEASKTEPNMTLSSSDHFVTPQDFDKIYDVPTALNGSGVTIGIVGRSRVNMADFAAFRSRTNATFSNPTEVIPTKYGGVDPGAAITGSNGKSTAATVGEQSEATLDVIRAGGVAPGAKLLLVSSASTSTTDGIDYAIQYIVDTTPVVAQVMTISFGLCESYAGQSDTLKWDGYFKQAAVEGISVFVSSGDSGASGCDTSFTNAPSSPMANSPNNLCSSSYATCVGGTEFADTANPSLYWSSTNSAGYFSALGYIPEGGWNEPYYNSNYIVAASGGGVSAYVATPSWQTGKGVPSARAGRYTPDISFSSSLHDGYFGCIAAEGDSCVADSSGYWYFTAWGGTSAAAPGMAGVAALAAQQAGRGIGNMNVQLYKLATSTPAAFHDTTVASSGVTGCLVTTPSMCNNSAPASYSLTGGQAGYLLTAGFDEVTGLGSLDIAKFVSAVGSSYPLAVATTKLATVYKGKSFSFALAARGGVAPYTWSATGLPTGVTLSTAGVLSGTVATTGTYSIVFTVTDSSAAKSKNNATLVLTVTLSPAATPTMSPTTSTSGSFVVVSISDTTPSSTIYYTTDGTTPTTASKKYTTAFPVYYTQKVNAIAVASGYSTSAVATATYSITVVPTPSFGLSYSAGVLQATLSDVRPSTAIHYTIDGSLPSSASTTYSVAIPLNKTMSIKAIGTATGLTQSSVAELDYIAPTAVTKAKLSIVGIDGKRTEIALPGK